jgi:uncharacterized protein
MVMKNTLYECSVMHCRLKPKNHAFNYRVFMFCVNLDELPEINSRLLGFSHNRLNLYSIDDRDHVNLGKSGGIKANLAAWLEQQNYALPEDVKIYLVTFPRVLGYGFNPVSFYYVYSKSGELLLAVAEVVNTFREMKLYLIKPEGETGNLHHRIAKNFYVSPFSDPGNEFDFQLMQPREKWQVNIDNYDAGERTLLSSVKGNRKELTSSRLIWYSIKYPFLSLKIIGLIHWHALLLWVRKVPFFRKHERLEVQLGVMRPDESLTKNLP